MTDRWQWKIKEDSVQDVSRNVRNCADELVQHLNCHAKQSAMEGPDE